MTKRTWRDEFTALADAKAEAEGISREDAAEQIYDDMDAQLSMAGIDIEEFSFDQPYVPLDQIIAQGASTRQAQQAAQESRSRLENNEWRVRSPSEAEYGEQQQRIGEQVIRDFGLGAAPAVPSMFQQEARQRAEGDPASMTLERVTSEAPPRFDMPVTASDQESRFDMSQRLGYEVTPQEYEQRIAEQKTETALSSAIVDGRPLRDLIPLSPEAEERQRLAIESADELRAEREAALREQAAEAGVGEAEQLLGMEGLDQVVMRGAMATDPVLARLPEQPDFTKRDEVSEYVRRLYLNPDVAKRVHDKRSAAAFKELGGTTAFGMRAFGAGTGALGARGVAQAELAEQYVLQPALAAVSTVARAVNQDDIADDVERTWFNHTQAIAQGKHWTHKLNLEDMGVKGITDAMAQNDKLIISRLEDKNAWAATRADLYDNIAGLGQLVATFMPTSLDVLRQIQMRGGTDDSDVAKALQSFQYGFDQGSKLPSAMAGAILSILRDPYKAVQAQPISTLMTILPFVKLAKAGGVRGIGAAFDKLDDIARKAGIDINDPKFQKLTLPESFANKVLNEARAYSATKWGKVVNSKIMQNILHKDYVDAVNTATNENLRMPGDVKFQPGVPLTAKVTAATYVMSQEDLGDAAIALATFGLPTALHTWVARHPEFGPKLAQSKAATGRAMVDIAAMADPALQLKVEQLVDSVLEQRNIVESDMKSIAQALWSDPKFAKLLDENGQLTPDAVNRLLPHAGESVAAHAALVGYIEGMPDVRIARMQAENARRRFEEARDNGDPNLEQLETEMLDARNEYRRRRITRMAENLDEPPLLMPEEGTQGVINRLVDRQQELRKELADDLALVDIEEAATLEKIGKATTTEQMNQLRDQLIDQQMKKVLGRTKHSERRLAEHLQQLNRLEQAVRGRSQEAKVQAINEYSEALKKAQDKYDALINEGKSKEAFMTDAQQQLINEMREAEAKLGRELADLYRAVPDAEGQINNLRDALLAKIQEQRAAAADSIAPRLETEARTRAAEQFAKEELTVENVRARYEAERAALRSAHNSAQRQTTASLENAQKMLEMWNTRARESIYFGNIADEGIHVYRAESPVQFSPEMQKFNYLDAEGKPTRRAGSSDRDGLLIDASESQLRPISLNEASHLQLLNQLAPEQASAALKAIDRLAETFASSDLGFHQRVNALDHQAVLNKVTQELEVPGARGGQNLAKRIYLQIFNNILFENNHSALLRSPNLRNKFTDWLNNKLEGAIELPPTETPRALRRQVRAGLAKIVNDFTFPRTKGMRFIEADPVFVLANGRRYRMSDAFAQFMNEQSARNPKLAQVSRVEALDTFRQQMINKVEEAAAAKWFWEQVGTPGWFDDGISVRYMTDIADYLQNNGHLPPYLKDSPQNIADLHLNADAVRTTLTGRQVQRNLKNREMVANELATRMMDRNPQMQYAEARQLAEQAVTDMNTRLLGAKAGDPNRFVSFDDNGLPSLEDRGGASIPEMERGAGIVRWKQPIQQSDMAGFAEMMGLKRPDSSLTPHINRELGGAPNSTLGWLFMANRTMASNGFFNAMRQMSSAIKRNLTTQRPQTALTNYLSNYLAMMTREGLLPQQAAEEMVSAANLWRTYAKDPNNLPKAQRDRIKAAFDRGIASNNAVNVDANIVMDTYQSNPLMKPVDWYATGFRKAPVIGKVMEGMDWAYQVGDGLFKLMDTMREASRLDQFVDMLRPGKQIQFKDTSRGGKVLGTVWRTQDGQFKVQYKGKTHTGNAAVKALENLKMDSAVGYANGLYFDYSRVPGFLELARNFDAIAFGPFKTWAWKSLDIPFLKRGIGTRALFGDTTITSTDPVVMSHLYKNEAMQGMRRAAVLSLTRETTRDDEYLRQLIPEWLTPGAFFDDETMTFQSLGNRNFAINLSNMLEGAWKMTRGTEEDILMARIRKKEKTPTEELAKLLLADGIVYGSLMELSEGKTHRGDPLETPQDFYQHFSNKLMPGWIHAGGESVMMMFDQMRPLTGLARANRFRDDKTRMDMASYMMKVWTGRRLEHFDEESINKVFQHLAGIKVTTNQKTGKTRYSAERKGTLLDKYFTQQYEQDVKEWEAMNGKDGLADYKRERRQYWISGIPKRDAYNQIVKDENGEISWELKPQKIQLKEAFLKMRMDFQKAWQAKREASRAFKAKIKAAKKGDKKAQQDLDNLFDVEESSDTMIDLGAEQLEGFTGVELP